MISSLSRREVLLRATAFAALASPLTAIHAQAYPTKPVRLVLPVGPGGGTDSLTRFIAEELRTVLGQPVVVDNRAGGAGGLVGAEHVARSAPDGYTLLVAAAGPLATHKFLYPKIGFEPSEFVPISLLATLPNVLLVRPDSPLKSFGDFLTFAKANPGKLNYATGGAGTSPHLGMELLKVKAGLDIQHVPFKGAAASTTGFLQGQGDVLLTELVTSMSHISSGMLVPLAVGSETRHPSLPNVPTMAQTMPGFTTTVWYGMVAPPKTPPDIAGKLSAAMVDIMKRPDLVKKLQAMHFQVIGSNSADMGKFVRQEAQRWEEIIRTAKITVN